MKKNAIPIVIIGLLMGMVLFSGMAVGEERLLVAQRYSPFNVATLNATNFTEISKYTGTPSHPLDTPYDVCNDDVHYFMVDHNTNELHKVELLSNALIDVTGGLGVGDDHFYNPIGVTVDNTYLYASDCNNHRIKKLLKSDLSYVSELALNYPFCVYSDDVYLYITAGGYHPLYKYFKSNLTFVWSYGTFTSGNDGFSSPKGITGNDTHLFIVDKGNDRVKVHLKFNGAYVDQVGTSGTGDLQFTSPHSIEYVNGYIYVGDVGNNRITVLNEDLTFFNKTDYYNPYGISFYDTDNVGTAICEWNQSVYDFSGAYPPLQFNYTIYNANPTLYWYNLSVYNLYKGCYIKEDINLNVSNNTEIVTITGCAYPHNYRGFLRIYYKSDNTLKNTLCTSDMSFINPYPVIEDLSFNKTTYNVTTVNKSFNLTYNITDPQTSCYTYKLALFYCSNEDCDGEDEIREITGFNASNHSIEGLFYTTDFDGWYKVQLMITDVGSGHITYFDSDTIDLTSLNYPDWYIWFDKPQYTTGETITITYLCNDSTDIRLRICRSFEGVYFTIPVKTYYDLANSGTVYLTLDEIGEYSADLFNPNTGMAETVDQTSVISTNAYDISIGHEPEDITHHYPSNTLIDFIISSVNEEDLTVTFYNPLNLAIATIPVVYSDYNDGIAYKRYTLQSTDPNGLYTVKLRVGSGGTTLASDTTYCIIGENNVSQLWFYPLEYKQGELIQLHYYLELENYYTLGVTGGYGSWIDSTTINTYGSSGYYERAGTFTYQTGSEDKPGRYGGVAFNNSGNNTPFVYCNLTKVYTAPDGKAPMGIDAFTNLVSAAGFGSEAGLFLVAALLILACMYFLAPKLDSKTQLILVTILICGFVIIGFIPVWILVVIALIVAATLTFNLAKV